MKNIKDLVGWIGLVLAISTGGISLYKTIIQSQMITAQNQERISAIAQMIDNMITRQLEIQERFYEHEKRLAVVEHELEGENND